jgi:hypothetical protein
MTTGVPSVLRSDPKLPIAIGSVDSDKPVVRCHLLDMNSNTAHHDFVDRAIGILANFDRPTFGAISVDAFGVSAHARLLGELNQSPLRLITPKAAFWRKV